MPSAWFSGVPLALLGTLLLPSETVSAAAPDPVTGGRQRVAVIRLDFEASVVEAGQELFAQRLVEGLTAAQFEVVAGPAVTTALAAAGTKLSQCQHASCYPAVAHALGVGYLVAGKVSASNKTYDITLELINGRTGLIIGTNRERCEICGVEDAGEKMGLAASALRARLEALTKTPARFVIRSRPPGAAVALDGQVIGRTPIDRELLGGPHKLTLTAPGYDVFDRTFTVVSGVDEALDLDLVRLPTKFPFRTAGWVGVAAGVLLLTAGIWAIAVDGNEIACSPSDRDPSGHCPEVRNTRILGAGLAGAGAVSATLGGVWLYLGGIRGSF